MVEPTFRIDTRDFDKAARALDAAARQHLKDDLNRRLKEAAKPLIGRTRKVAKVRVPERGGLAAKVAAAPQEVEVRVTRADAGVRVGLPRRGRGVSAAKQTDSGRVRHPTFGGDPWVTQRIQGGWFTETMRKDGPGLARPALEKALRETLERIEREGD